MCVGTARAAQIISGVITNELDDARKKLNERYQSECRMPYNQPAQKQKNGDDRER